jgi:hypothetical protein
MPAADRTKNRYVGPTDIQFAVFGIHGVMLPVLADLPEGGFVQWVTGDNPLQLPIPGVHIKPGSMVLMIVPELAEQVRKDLLDAWDKAETMDLSDITGG